MFFKPEACTYKVTTVNEFYLSFKGSGRSYRFYVMRKVYLGQARFLEGKHCPQKYKLQKFKEKRKLKGFFYSLYVFSLVGFFLLSFNKDIHLFLMINIRYVYELLYMPRPKEDIFSQLSFLERSCLISESLQISHYVLSVTLFWTVNTFWG